MAGGSGDRAPRCARRGFVLSSELHGRHHTGSRVPALLMTDFRPLPLLGNPHLQTLLGTWLKGPLFSLPSRARHVLLPDGDRLVLHDSIPAGWNMGDRLVLLIHGLSGSHRSSYMGRLAGLLLARRSRVVRMDLRGCGRGIALARR